MSHKISGKSCKINDLFCYLKSSSAVKRLDFCNSFAPPLKNINFAVLENKNVVPLCMFFLMPLITFKAH